MIGIKTICKRYSHNKFWTLVNLCQVHVYNIPCSVYLPVVGGAKLTNGRRAGLLATFEKPRSHGRPDPQGEAESSRGICNALPGAEAPTAPDETEAVGGSGRSDALSKVRSRLGYHLPR